MRVPRTICRDFVLGQDLTCSDAKVIMSAVQDVADYSFTASGGVDVEIVENNGFDSDLPYSVCRSAGLAQRAQIDRCVKRVNDSSWYCGTLRVDEQPDEHVSDGDLGFFARHHDGGISVHLPMQLAHMVWGASINYEVVDVPDDKLAKVQSRFGFHALLRVHWWNHIAGLRIKSKDFQHIGPGDTDAHYIGSDIVETIIRPKNMALLFGHWNPEMEKLSPSVVMQRAIAPAIEDLKRAGIWAACDIVEPRPGKKSFRFRFCLKGTPTEAKRSQIASFDAEARKDKLGVFGSYELIVDALLDGTIDRARALELLPLMRLKRGRPQSSGAEKSHPTRHRIGKQLSTEIQVNEDSVEFS